MKKILLPLAVLLTVISVIGCQKDKYPIPIPDNSDITGNWKLDSTIYLKYFDSIPVQRETKYIFTDRLNLKTDNTYEYTRSDSVLSLGKYVYYNNDRQLVFSDGYSTTEASVTRLTNNILNYVISSRHPDPDSAALRMEKWHYYTK